MAGKIAFQGELGAYGHQACADARPEFTPLPCMTFHDTMAAVRDGAAELAMVAVENSIYGRVADVHQLLPDSGLHIVDEAFVRVHVNLLGVRGASVEQVREAHGHPVILPQCSGFLRTHGIKGVISSDNARAAREVAEQGDPTQAALASVMAAEIYGLDVLARNIEDRPDNTTRFLIMAREIDQSRRGDQMMTSFLFRVRNIPAALYKAMGGFATNNVNMLKLESYMVDGSFTATQFFAEIEGHPEDEHVARA
ncbi:MAG: prephenate dehydratase, partial [Roseinatronobacter sp.]